MKIDFANLKKAHLEYADEINFAIQKVIQNTSFIMGEEIQALEEELANFVGCEYAITCSNGTSALLLALMGAGIQAGDEVITSPFSFIAGAEMIALLGAKPVFVDIDPQTFHIHPKYIPQAITPKTKAIMPVSLFGQIPDMDTINAIAKQHHLIVIEDGAQSFGAMYKSRKSGNQSPLAITSFFPSKPLGCYGDGGAVFCNDKNLADKIKTLRIHGQSKRYQHSMIGLNARLDTLQAAILRIKLKHYPDQIARRQKVAMLYNKHLQNKSITLPYTDTKTQNVYAQYCILTSDREGLQKNLSSYEIPYAIHYPKPLHLQDCFAYLNYHQGDFGIAERVSNEILSLPMNAYLSEDEIKYISKAILECL
ncbi:DegT/DnrJ/EryC1/StrS family aminotransferase [Helicobacter sp. 11S03491-1]|uniref:DegT/DnrJ/EryC1/StrS family aminotransferase n=1 Tax=Helicobacter sp. 11S03491-1 TaxID=1476196 RepID=UPI000BA5F9A1|nr:DegT/DnrJ/EryC1/StrS family aminotransferase [Helicobacter sp. 11S03491-1]PAF43800.1 aminotransferase DegT [Helicobacter sp. 11S03491-1]